MAQPLSRRRFIGISAAAAGMALLPLAGHAAAYPYATVWRGRALGAPAEMIVHHPDRALAELLVRRAAGEIERLERIFSLYLPHSALSQLNRLGALASPPPELVDLLARCRGFHARTGGLFDPTVQPLWALYARHYSEPGADPTGPSRGQIEAARNLIGLDRVSFDANRIAFARRGMAITLNGVAQGYITDRVVDLFRDAGLDNTLADIGEVRALGGRGDGSPWQVGIAGTDVVLDLVDRAVATSGMDGFRFGGAGSPSHILDPLGGAGSPLSRSVSVVAGDATTADALSTAFGLMDPQAIAAVLDASAGVEAHLQGLDGLYLRLG